MSAETVNTTLRDLGEFSQQIRETDVRHFLISLQIKGHSAREQLIELLDIRDRFSEEMNYEAVDYLDRQTEVLTEICLPTNK